MVKLFAARARRWTTGSKQVKYRVNDGTMARSARSPARPCCRQYGAGVGQVGVVESSAHNIPLVMAPTFQTPTYHDRDAKVAIVLRERLWYLLTLMASNTSARARFREALKAVHVVKGDNGWEVLRAGHRPVKFSDRRPCHRGRVDKGVTGGRPQGVFINCPFDPEYRPIFEAVVFAVHRCGFVARCALEDGDSDVVRIAKILRMIRDCALGIHDLSRVDAQGKLPRFNMPFELGLFMGARQFGRALSGRNEP